MADASRILLADHDARNLGAMAAAGARLLAAAGLDTPARDARLLLAHASGLEPTALDARPEVAPAAGVRAAYEAALGARLARRPVSHILGRRAFGRHVFEVGPDVLDPRPESEALVEAALAHLAPDRPAAVLDLGVGSGCLLLSVLAERPAARGLGVDVSAAALAVAARNAARLGLDDRVTLRRGDWLADVEGRFDAILCNPPYIDLETWRALAPEVRDREPKAALTPGTDGLAVYRALARDGLAARLAPGGAAFLEVGRGQAEAVAALMAGTGLDARTVPDLGGVERVVCLRPLVGAPATAGAARASTPPAA